MSKFRVYKYLSYNKSKILKALFLVAVMLLAIVPVIYLVKFFLPQGTSASFELEYLNPDANYGVIDYLGIESEFEVQTYLKYYLDGQLFTTISNTIDLFFNDFNEHNLTIYFSGETYEKIFNSSISLETITLACKSIETTVMWADIDVIIEGMTVTLQYFDGTSWINIQPAVSDANGLVSFVGLVMGDYRLDTIEFTIEQPMTMYTTENIYVIADKTVIDIEYLNTIFGLDYPVDISTLSWELQIYMSSSEIWAQANSGHYKGIIVDNVAGTITIYELMNGYDFRIAIFDYAGADLTYDIVSDGLTYINLNAKSLDAEFLWNGDNAPVVGMDFELFMQDGAEWISVGIYQTDINGKIILTNELPMGNYRFNNLAEFSIIANDNVKITTSVIESLCVRKKSFSLGFYNGTVEFKYFSFCI